MDISLNLFQTEAWFGGDVAAGLELYEIADAKGVDVVTLPEHVVMGSDISAYPYGASFDSAQDFFEPMVFLAAIAARTRRVRLSTGVLLAGLRPAPLLAKQIATLDQLSRGRVELALGVGWQKAEYDILGLAWETRFQRMIETVEACRELWTRAPASYAGKLIRFGDAWSHPFPLQGRDVPLMFGIAATDLGIERMATYADGWAPLGLTLEQVDDAMGRIRRRLVEKGRDPAKFKLRLPIPFIRVDGKPDLAAGLAKIPDLVAVGCDDMAILMGAYCTNRADYEPMLDDILAARAA